MKSAELPRLPSEQIRLALKDLAVVEASPYYVVDMMEWHTPGSDGEPCSVCFAGAVMANTIGVDKGNKIALITVFDGHNRRVFMALNEFRQGWIERGIHALMDDGLMAEFKKSGLPSYVDIDGYDSRPACWRADMNLIADMLAAANL